MIRGRYGSKSGKREDLGGLYVRSAWEANVARILQWKLERGEIAKWEYEPVTFVFKDPKTGDTKISHPNTYLPDFLVTRKDGSVAYLEVKGQCDREFRTRTRLMRSQYPEAEINFVTTNKKVRAYAERYRYLVIDYRELALRYKRHVKWE